MALRGLQWGRTILSLSLSLSRSAPLVAAATRSTTTTLPVSRTGTQKPDGMSVASYVIFPTTTTSILARPMQHACVKIKFLLPFVSSFYTSVVALRRCEQFTQPQRAPTKTLTGGACVCPSVCLYVFVLMLLPLA